MIDDECEWVNHLATEAQRKALALGMQARSMVSYGVYLTDYGYTVLAINAVGTRFYLAENEPTIAQAIGIACQTEPIH